MEDMTTLPLPAPRQRGAGRLLRQRARSLAQAAVTPLDLDDLLDHFLPLRRGAEQFLLDLLPDDFQRLLRRRMPVLAEYM